MDWLALLAVQGTLKNLLQHQNLKEQKQVKQSKEWQNKFWWGLKKILKKQD